jgi:hypothetical protein
VALQNQTTEKFEGNTNENSLNLKDKIKQTLKPIG